MDTNSSLDVISREPAGRRATGRWALAEHLRRAHENSALFVRLAREAGIDTGDSACDRLIPCIVGSSKKALHLSDALTRRGIIADAIIFPAAPKDQARLRFFVTSCHSETAVRFMVTALAEELQLLEG